MLIIALNFEVIKTRKICMYNSKIYLFDLIGFSNALIKVSILSKTLPKLFVSGNGEHSKLHDSLFYLKNMIYLHLPLYLYVITLRTDFVWYSPIHH